MSVTHNIVVLSDLHLGEDLTPAATAKHSRDLRLAESHLMEFLRKYTRGRMDGRPWRLVINGDMVDFMSICIFPGEHPSLQGRVHSREDEMFGLDRRKDAACLKLEAVFAHHVEFFRTLAQFVAAGNAVEIICGNHDTEFIWPEVQEAFWRGMAQVAAQHLPSAAGLSEERLRASIRFHPWFYYEPGVAWIEHGHQYDECCSHQYNLNPVDARGQTLVANVDTAGLRYVTNQIAEADPHGTEEWSFGGYMRLAHGLGWAGAWRLASGYGRFALRLIREWRNAQLSRTRRLRRAVHQERLRELGRVTPLGDKTLRKLDSMHRPPVVVNLRRILHVLMLDKLMVVALAALVSMLAMVALPMMWALVLMVLAVVGANRAFAWLSRGRSVDATLPLQIVPARILQHVDARYVVFGHTHLPMMNRLPNDCWYVNTGTWMPVGKQGLLRSFTHLVIRFAESGPEATLCQWRDGASRKFTRHWEPEAVRAAEKEKALAPRPGAGLLSPSAIRARAAEAG